MTAHETVRLTADVALFAHHQGELCVLLIQRGKPPFQGCWALPGGHVEPGEATILAALRELAEEAGLRVDTMDLVGAYATPGRDPRGRYVTFAYTATLPALVEPAAGDDARYALWCPVEAVLGDPEALAFDHHRILTDALRVNAQPHPVPTGRLEAVLAQLDKLTTSHRLDSHLLIDQIGEAEEITDRHRQVAHEASEVSFELAARLLREALGGDR